MEKTFNEIYNHELETSKYYSKKGWMFSKIFYIELFKLSPAIICNVYIFILTNFMVLNQRVTPILLALIVFALLNHWLLIYTFFNLVDYVKTNYYYWRAFKFNYYFYEYYLVRHGNLNNDTSDLIDNNTNWYKYFSKDY